MSSHPDFLLVRSQHIAELRATARVFVHARTGAELMSIENDDENKVFGITFRTPPEDSTGIAHILEHSVLCGSRKYPVREPFVELLKGSLQTFLNAFTYPDKTCYPVASQNLRDFYNLIDVYLDAVLYPLLTRRTYEQEAWHYELESMDAPLQFKGVVFNEMKGAYASPDNVLAEQAQESLFPDTPYGVDSGGDPQRIPDLTYDALRAFHHRYYHPSNARIYFYGDDDPDRRLQLMAEWLKPFERIEIRSQIPLQPRFAQPRRLDKPFQVGPDEQQEAKGMLTVNWLLCEPTNIEEQLALQILAHILIGTPASPLRKALIESGLGEDLAGVGFEPQLRQMYFSTGLKGIEVADADKVESLILNTLQQLAQRGLDRRTVEASLNTVEFQLRENNTGSYPRGLALMIRSLGSWLYEGNPIAPLMYETPLASIRAIAGNANYFEDMIQRYLLDNSHRTTLLLRPDPALGPSLEAKERARLDAARKAMTSAELDAVIANTRELKRLQVMPDPPEALAKIPSLTLADLPRQNKTIPIDVSEQDGATILFHDLFTQGILYLDVGVNVRRVPAPLLSYIPLFGRALLEMGTAAEDYVSLAQRIGSRTGGIEPQLFAATVRESRESSVWLFLRGKAMVDQAGECFAILTEALTSARLDLRERFRQIVLEEKAMQEAQLTPAGHTIVGLRLRSRLSEADWVSEQTRGVSYLFFLRELAGRIERDWPGVESDLEQLRRILLSRKGMMINATVDAAAWLALQPHVQQFLSSLPATDAPHQSWQRTAQEKPEGLAIPAQVNYVGKGADLYRLGYRFHGSALVIARYLRTAWLWERVRVQGGAYGCFSALDYRSGAFNFVSYRDPNIEGTLRIYDETAAYLKSLKLDHAELTRGIIGAIGDMDAYQLPDAKGFTSMSRHLTNDTAAFRQQIRDHVLSTTPDDFRRFGEILDAMSGQATVVVMGGESALAKAGGFVITRVL